MEQQQQTPRGGEMDHPCFIMIRFQKSMRQTCKNSLIKHLSIHSNYDGSVSGVTPLEGTERLEGGWADDKGVALLYFRTRRSAQLWYDSVPEIKQQDWLGFVDMVMFPVCQQPDPESIHYIQVLDLEFSDFHRFQNDYSSDASAVIQSHGGKQIVSTPKAHKLRGLWEPQYLILNCWGSKEKFDAAYYGEKNQDLKYRRQQCSQASSCVFELEPLTHRC